MGSKNTTEIGDDFENRALGILEKALLEDQLGHNAQFAKIHKKKKYRTVNGDFIEFDLTIEIWPPGAPNYTFIYIIECKNYSSTIPAKNIPLKLCSYLFDNFKKNRDLLVEYIDIRKIQVPEPSKFPDSFLLIKKV